ncbi:RcpC/CpaB family pilus assembly protein [Alkalicoccus halolimnae]|uniref:RcpC/CpaB family pilus assembly protein n=1 Tax=Alkalicoccus halolimnae TaxID=1667239 RepID=A0A5C7F920_9BACI|nr:RcpC/CpaB family pilus assembly protein [Alkalicoccus halolimnae]TXF86100.1 hypothetical protein FTX54_05645 [Alkalicoccus halolimnae]
MSTKKIWIIAIFTGFIAAILLYSSLISSSSSQEEEQEQQALEQQAAEQAEEEALTRQQVNPMDDIEQGMRAVSIPIDNTVHGVSGYIEPKSHVDIIAFETLEPEMDDEDSEEIEVETAGEELSAELLLQNVKVLAAGRAYDAEADALRYVQITVEVTPEEGVLLSLAEKNADGFYFMLRDEEDDSIEEEGVEITRPILRGEGQ